MVGSSIAYLDVSFFVHATEDEEKVIKALKNVVSPENEEKIIFKKSNLKGDYGNPIIFFKTRIENEAITESILKNISSKLSDLNKQNLQLDLRLHLEKGNLYIRLDKQAAFKGDLKFFGGDPIRLRVRFKKSKNEDVIEICRDIGLLP